MNKTIFFILVLAAVPAVRADESRFTASDLPSVHVKKGVVIRNNDRAITAYQFFGNVRESLFSLRASKRLATHSYGGGSLFNANAPLPVRVPAHLSLVIAEAARTHGVDPRLIAAVATRESAWNASALSPVGAGGLMQLMPATARYLGVNNVFDPRQNIFGGTRYLRTLLDTFHGDLDLTLAAYNAGPGAVAKYNGVPPYRETRAYVVAVRQAYERSVQAQ